MAAGIDTLLSALAVRDRARMVLARGRAGRLAHFRVRMDRLPATADYVAETIRRNYPDLAVPPHARWRHFVIGGTDRWRSLAAKLSVDAAERARIRFDLAVTSVLLDAGAGLDWSWRDAATGTRVGRSEGLALASLEAFARGAFSSDPAQPLRADAVALQAVTSERLGVLFQVAPDNPLLGLDGRAALMRRLGRTMAGNGPVFGNPPRIGGLYDRLVEWAASGSIAAPRVLELLLTALGPIWPGRLAIDDVALGDTWCILRSTSMVRRAG